MYSFQPFYYSTSLLINLTLGGHTITPTVQKCAFEQDYPPYSFAATINAGNGGRWVVPLQIQMYATNSVPLNST